MFAAGVLWFAGARIAAQWSAARAQGFGFHLNWLLVVVSALIVFAAYAMLVETWRIMVRDWGSSLRWPDAARIWFVSNLGRYVPGKVWQIGAMGVMAQRAGVQPVAATGSSVVINVVLLLAGVGVVAVTGARLLGKPALVMGAAVVVGIAVLLTPRLLPFMLRMAERAVGRKFESPPLPRRPIWIAGAASIAAWTLYGVAFYVFSRGVAPGATGPVSSYVAAFTASYLIGYVTLFVPGGLVVRESALAASLVQLGLATSATSVLIAVASRLWLTVIEVLPGAIFFALGARRRPRTPHPMENASNR